MNKFQWEQRSHYSHYETLSSHQVERELRSVAYSARQKNAKTETVTSQLVLNISNWSFVRDLTLDKVSKFTPCSVQDVHVAIKLSSTVFKPQKRGSPGDPDSASSDSEFFFDRNGAVLPFAAFVSLLKDVSFTGDFMQRLKTKFEEDLGRSIFPRNKRPCEAEPDQAARERLRRNLAEQFEELREPGESVVAGPYSTAHQDFTPLSRGPYWQQQHHQNFSGYFDSAQAARFSLPPPPPPPPKPLTPLPRPATSSSSSVGHPAAPSVGEPSKGRTKRAAAVVASLSLSREALGDELRPRKKKGSKVTLQDDENDETPEDDNHSRTSAQLLCGEVLEPEPEEGNLEEEEDDDEDDEDVRKKSSRRSGPRDSEQSARLDQDLLDIADSIQANGEFCQEILELESGGSGGGTPRSQTGSNYSGSLSQTGGPSKKGARIGKKH